MYPKDFIKQVFITELEPLTISNPYIAFSIMASGIEFLGKCLDTKEQNWNGGNSARDFKTAIRRLDAFGPYRPLLGKKYDLWDSFRNGFSHSFVPKAALSLSSKNEDAHLARNEQKGQVNLRCEDLFQDFRAACLQVIDIQFEPGDKMNRQLLQIP